MDLFQDGPRVRVEVVADGSRTLKSSTEPLSDTHRRSFSDSVRVRVPGDLDPGGHTLDLVVEPLDCPGADVELARLELAGGPAPYHMTVRGFRALPRAGHRTRQAQDNAVHVLVDLRAGADYTIAWRLEARAGAPGPDSSLENLCDCGARHTALRVHYPWCSAYRGG